MGPFEQPALGDESACATFYAIFEIGVQLTEVTFSGEECDV